MEWWINKKGAESLGGFAPWATGSVWLLEGLGLLGEEEFGITEVGAAATAFVGESHCVVVIVNHSVLI